MASEQAGHAGEVYPGVVVDPQIMHGMPVLAGMRIPVRSIVIGGSNGVKVTVEDANGNAVTSNSASVTMAILNDADGGTLSGTTPVNAVAPRRRRPTITSR